MMSLINFLKSFFKRNTPTAGPIMMPGGGTTYVEGKKGEKSVISVWDVLRLTEHTQAFHLVSVIRFDEWVTMDEVRRRIFELFQVDYENERSLYPYLKTMVDLGLIESTNIGGKRKWRKKDLLVKVEIKKEEKEEIGEKQAATA